MSTAPAEDDKKQRERARRLARTIITDIMIYNQDTLDIARSQRSIAKLLAQEITRGKKLYEEKVGPQIAKSTDYFDKGLIDILAEGNPRLMG
ncbi:hypothetical protein JW905_12410 [bacterium]|nr:hypothetical protein [candidate division CSSED10-310 bacterium]